MGRPPKDKVGGPMNGMHLGLRLNQHRTAQLKRLVDHANELAAKAGYPRAFTASALVTDVLNRWLDEENAKLDATIPKIGQVMMLGDGERTTKRKR